jgi:hypothetical protein
MQFSNYQDNIENTDGIYTGFSEELPYDRKTEDAYLDVPSIAPIILVSKKKSRKNKKKKLVIKKNKTNGSGPARLNTRVGNRRNSTRR